MRKQEKLYLGTNTKMYKTAHMTREYLLCLRELTMDIPSDELELFVLPSFTSLTIASQCVRGSWLRIGAQNMSWEDEGPLTGEVSPLMLQESGAEIVMIGHSERRHVMLETDQLENRKLLCAIRHGLTPLLCIGETAEEKAISLSNERLRMQIKIGLNNLTPTQAGQIWVAYEPVWSIGEGGIPASKEYAEEKHGMIRDCLCEMFGQETGQAIPLLYGGSVNLDNAVELISRENIDGLFIGRNAWQADSFNEIIREVLPLWREK